MSANLASALLGVSIALAAARPAPAAVIDVELARFATAKQEQAREFAKGLTNPIPSYTWSFFDALQVDDWETATNLAAKLNAASGRYNADTNLIVPALYTVVWQPIAETIWAYRAFHDWDNKLAHRFGSEIISSIPRGSVFFGGTDPGRFLISALSESHREGNPFFTITQNQLADGSYLDYLRQMYGQKLKIPTDEDSQKAFQEYLDDAHKRLKAGKLKPGEDVRIVNDRVQVSGQVAVLEINGLLAKIILEKNPDRSFFVEESFPLEWMYPHLAPHGPIFELHQKPLLQLRTDTVLKDQEYWNKLVSELVGDSITEKTSVKEICNFTEKVYLQKDLDGFKGYPGFAKDKEAQKCFSKLRSSIAGLYVWRAGNSKDENEREQMHKAADLAHRQAFALCPYSHEALFRYVNQLVQRKRVDEAILLAQTSLRFDPDNTYVKDLVRSLRKME